MSTATVRTPPAPIQYLDGIRFKRVVIAAAERVIRKQDHLDEINVFPVPDGDTGANMAGTMRAVVEAIRDTLEMRINSMSKHVAESALMGARGNSGVILAQFLTGFSEGVKNLGRVTPSDFVDAADLASEQALDAMENPADGTILTVIQDWVQHLKDNRDSYSDFQQLLYDSVERARKSLEETTKKLACLKKAGVVDAGAQGFVYLLEGIVEFTEKGRITITDTRNSVTLKSTPKAIEKAAVEDLTFRYCTECMVTGEDIDGKALRKQLSPLGDSLIVAGSSTSKRIHIHTDEPEKIFKIGSEYGTVDKRKIDDMLSQHRELLTGKSAKPAIVTDSTCDLPAEIIRKYNIRMAPLRLRLDGEEFLDKIDITPDEFFRRLPQSKTAQSSQPPPFDFIEQYRKALKGHEEVLCIHIASVLSGTGQSARTAAETLSDRITLVDSKNLAMTLGLIVKETAELIEQGASVEEAAAFAREAGDKATLVVSMASLDQVIKGGRVSKTKGLIAKALGIKPILEFVDGKPILAAKPRGRENSIKRLLEITEERMQGKTNPRFMVGHAGAPEYADKVVEHLKKTFGVDDVPVVVASPAVCIHCGPRCVAIAMLGD